MTLTREQVAGLLARTDAAALVELADAIIEQLPSPTDIRITRPPQVGAVQVHVREPLAGDRFILSDALACNVEIRLGDQPGFAVRLGEDTLAVTAQAICEAEYAAGRARADDVRALCEQTAARIEQARSQEWDDLRPTIVEFEEVL